MINFLAPPTLADRDTNRRAGILYNASLLAIGFLSITLVASYFLLPDPLFPVAVIGSLILIAVIGLVLLHHGHVTLVAYLWTTCLGTGMAVVSFFAGGVSYATYTILTIVVLAGGILLGKRAGLAIAFFASGVGLALLAAENLGRLPTMQNPPNSQMYFITGVIIFFWSAYVIYISQASTEEALRQADQEVEQRKITQHALQRQLDDMRVINAVATASAQAFNEDSLIEKVTEIIKSNFAGKYYGVMLYDEQTQKLDLHPSYQIPEEYKKMSAQISKGIVGYVARNRAPLLVQDVSNNDLYHSVVSGIKSELCVPIMTAQGLKGVINVESEEIEAFSLEDEQLLVTIADQLATAIERLRLTGALNLTEGKYHSLFESIPIGLLHASAEGIIFDANPALVNMLGYPNKDALIGKNVEELIQREKDRLRLLALIRRRGIVENLILEITCFNGTKLFIEGNLKVNKNDDGAITSFEASAQNVTNRIRAEERQRNYANRLEVQRDIGKAILRSQNPTEIIKATLGRIHRLFPCNLASVVIYDEPNGCATLYTSPSQNGFGELNGKRLPLAEIATYPALKSKTDIAIVDLSQEKEKSIVEQELYASGCTSYISLPLPAGDRVIGSLNISFERMNSHKGEYLEIAGDLADSLAVALQNTNLLRESQQQALELSGLYETALAITTELNPASLLNRLYLQINALIEPDVVMVALYEPESQGLRIAMAIEDGESLEDWHNLFVPLSDGGLTGYILEQGKSLLIGDLLRDPLPVEPKHSARPARSWMGVPLVSRERILGVISIQSFTPDIFDHNQLRFVESLAAQVAIALENASLFDSERKRSAELAAIAGISSALRLTQKRDEILQASLEQVTKEFNASAGVMITHNVPFDNLFVESGIGLWSDWQGEILDSSNANYWNVFLEQKPYVNNDTNTGSPGASPVWLTRVTAIACVPLIARTDSLGMMCIGRTMPFGEAEVNSLTAIADIVANAIYRANLFEQTENRLRHLQALRRVDQAITGSVDLNQILSILLQQATQQLRVDAATVLLIDPRTQLLHTQARNGFHTGALQHTRLHIGESYAGQAALERRTILLRNINDHPGSFERVNALQLEGFQSYVAVPLLAKGEVKGVLEIFHRSFLEPDQEWLDFLEMLASQAAIAIDNASMFRNIQRSNMELSLAYDITLEGWAKALELRDQETEGHSRRVTQMTLDLAHELGMSNEDLIHVRRGALLHDIGKMGVPDSILLKPGNLTDEEWQIMKQHTVYAYNMLSPIRFLHPALPIPYSHHEHWDGNGYPQGLTGEQIPLEARIFSVVDVYDALTSDRPYRRAWSLEKTLRYIKDRAGTQFDPMVTQAFFHFLSRMGIITSQ